VDLIPGLTDPSEASDNYLEFIRALTQLGVD